jgi:hypothetical protein
VERIVKQLKLKPYKRQSKPLLSDKHKARRLRFCDDNSNRDWRQVLFTDEKTFEVFGRPKNDYIYARSREEVPFRQTVKHPPKLHVWAGMSYWGKTELYCFTGNMDAHFFLGILEERLVADTKRIFGDRRWVFQQDGDPKHTSKLVQGWLEENVDEFFAKGDWPAQSPDANVQEHLWSILQDRVYARNTRTIEQLQQILEDEWDAIPLEMLQSLVNSMPRRLAAIRAADGGATRY